MFKKVFFLVVLSLVVFSCKSDNDKTKKDNTDDSGPQEMNIVGNTITISGLVSIEESGRVVITEKSESRSMVSYIVSSDNSDQLKNYNDKTTTVSVKITKKISDWSYECELIKIN